MKNKVLLGLSWWVDSAVAGHLLLEQGYEVVAGFMKNYANEANPNCQTREDRDMAIKVAQHLGITTFVIFDFRKQYDEKVIQYIYDTYQQGRTPNPDILCNTEIKFKLFLEEGMKLGCELVAMGHYARVVGPHQINQDTHKHWSKDSDKWYHLLKGVDENKDQSYFLAWLNQDQLSKALFPLGEMTKPQVRELAKKLWLPNATRKDSQGLCFIGKVDMKDFLKQHLPIQKGVIKDTAGKVLGEHEGVHFYTIGQRQWLGLSGWPWYVIRRDIESNELIVWPDDTTTLHHDSLIATDRHRVAQPKSLPFNAHAKIRYRQEDQAVTISQSTQENELLLTFDQPQRAISSGQTVAVYEWDELIASGIIQ